MKQITKKELPSELQDILRNKLKAFAMLICESMIHIDVCLNLENRNFPKLNSEETSALHTTHFKLSIIETSKLLSFKVGDNGSYTKNENDKFSIYSILAFVDGLKPQYKSESLIRELNTLKTELHDWERFHCDVLNLRNEGYAHLGTESRRKKLNFVGTNHLNNLIVLLNDFHLLFNREYQLGLADIMSLNLEIISNIYKKGFS